MLTYRVRQDEEGDGDALTRMAPRALMIPPGVPDFPTRERLVELGACEIEGRAWSGVGAGHERPGEHRRRRLLGGRRGGEQDTAPFAWTAWRYTWTPDTPGRYVLTCRAGDAAGNDQPVDPSWNLGGYANNAVQRVAVTVRRAS